MKFIYIYLYILKKYSPHHCVRGSNFHDDLMFNDASEAGDIVHGNLTVVWFKINPFLAGAYLA